MNLYNQIWDKHLEKKTTELIKEHLERKQKQNGLFLVYCKRLIYRGLGRSSHSGTLLHDTPQEMQTLLHLCCKITLHVNFKKSHTVHKILDSKVSLFS